MFVALVASYSCYFAIGKHCGAVRIKFADAAKHLLGDG